MKKIVSLVLALSMVLSMFTTAFAGTSIKDVEGTDYEAAVSALVELGVVAGFEEEDGTFTYRPTEVVTRAQMAKLLVVSAGLEPAADVAKGATNFTDVDAAHWATGYINVAAQYGFINGYPDGTFNPDAPVTYAEAVTMAIRVLGYKSVVEAKGTWPTNYIAKAQELKVLKDVKYSSYAEGAERGNVSLLIWNMLRTQMWDVDSENETNGLTYGKKDTMINKYFAGYEYIDEDNEYVITNIDVDDGKVTIDLESEEKDVANRYDIELSKNTDFLNLLGRKVSGLYNTEDEKMVVIVPVSSQNTVVKNDYKEELDNKADGDYKFNKVKSEKTWGKKSVENGNDYTVAVIGSSKKVDYATYYQTAESYVVKEAKMNRDTLKVTTVEDETKKITEENAIVLIDGKWATREDIKAGDVVTVLIENELYVVNREQITGSFKDASEDFIKIDDTKYEHLITNKLFELVDEDKEKYDTVKFNDLDADSKYFDEKCTVYVNFLGEVVRVEFDEITDETDGSFYVLTNVPGSWNVSDKSGITTYVELNGESYELKSTAPVSGELKGGSIVFVKFDKKDRVTAIEVIQEVSGDVFKGSPISTTVDKDEKYAFELVNKELDDNYVGNYKISQSTTVYTITPVEDDDNDIVGYEVETSKGQNSLKGIEASVIAYKEGSKVASYAFVLEDAKNTDIEYGIIDEDGVQAGKKTQQVAIDGKTYTVDEDDNTSLTSNQEGNVIAFNDDKDGIRIKNLFSVTEFKANFANNAHRIIIDESDSRIFRLSGDDTISGDLDDDKYDDTTFVLVNYDMDDEEFTSVDTYTSETLSLDDDYIYVGARSGIKDTIYIVKGYDFDYVADTTVDEPVQAPSGDTVTVTFIDSRAVITYTETIEKGATAQEKAEEIQVQIKGFKGWSLIPSVGDPANYETPANFWASLQNNAMYYAITVAQAQ